MCIYLPLYRSIDRSIHRSSIWRSIGSTLSNYLVCINSLNVHLKMGSIYIYLSIHPSIYLSIDRPITCRSIDLSVYLTNRSISISTCLSVYPSIFLSIYRLTYHPAIDRICVDRICVGLTRYI